MKLYIIVYKYIEFNHFNYIYTINGVFSLLLELYLDYIIQFNKLMNYNILKFLKLIY